MEGELEKRIKDKSIDGLFTEFYLLEIIKEAKKELLPNSFWLKWAKIDCEGDDQITKDYKYLLLKLFRWFGDLEDE